MTGRKDAEKEFRKNFIAEVAYRLFAKRSFEAVTVEDIARAAEFGKGTIYQYFESKEEILVYVIQQGIAGLCRRIEAECLAEGDPCAALNKLIDLQYEFHVAYGPMFLSLLRRKLDGLLSVQCFEQVKDQYEAKNRLTAQVLDKGIRDGVFISADNYKLARVLGSVVKGFVVERLEQKTGEAGAADDLGLIKQVLLHGILRDKGEGSSE